MKNSALIIAIFSLAIVACSTQKQATSTAGDDVYYSPARGEQPVAGTAKPQTSSAQVVTSPDNTNVQKPGSSSLADDYNDYSYAGRINRFNSKDTTRGYFDDAYSNGSSYSNGGDNSPDVNVYLGYGAGYGGSYNSFSYGAGWGYPYSNWGWDYGWGYPYYGWGMNYGWGWGYPHYGWYDPWYNPCCYCYGYNEGYYGGYPANYSTNTYYGSRRSLYGTTGGGGTGNSRNASNPSGGNVNQIDKSRVTPNYSRTEVQPSTRTVPANQEKYRYTQPVNTRQTVNQRSTGRNQVRSQNQTQRQQPAPRYARPENVTPVQRSGTVQSYSSPVYRQPKTSQEYLGTQNPGSTRITNQQTGNRSNPGYSGESTRQSSTPSSNRNYTPATRSNQSGTSTPSRSNSNYSAPTRSGSSGGSYSAPARSGGNSGSAPSGGGSSGNGRRK